MNAFFKRGTARYRLFGPLSLLLSLIPASPAAAQQGRIQALEELRALAPDSLEVVPAVQARAIAAPVADGDECPQRGRMLPETAKAEVVSVSDAFGYDFMRDFVLEVARAQPDSPPVFLLNARPDNIKRLRKEISGGIRPGKLLASRLRPLSATFYDDDDQGDRDLYFEWQQDFYKPQFDPGTGRPVAALISRYPGIGNLPEALSRELSNLGIGIAQSPNQSAANGFSGGNMDMLPGGVCVMGDADIATSQWKPFAASMCGEDAALLQAPTSWLASAHVDELLRVVPNKAQSGCAYSVLLASPRKALELLRDDPGAPAYAGLPGVPHPVLDMGRIIGWNWVCATSQALRSSDGAKALRPRPEKELFSDLMELRPPVEELNCPDLKNEDVAVAFEANPVLKEYTALVQAKLDRFSGGLMSALESASPSCRFDMVEVPALFAGAVELAADGGRCPASGQEFSGYSIYPSPANSVLIGRRLILPDPYNPSFADYLRRALSDRGIEARFMDTIKAHEYIGDAHCATQVLRSCRPRK